MSRTGLPDGAVDEAGGGKTVPRRRVLFVSHVFPWPLHNGTVLRVHHLLRAVAARHDVTLVACVSKGEEELDQQALMSACTLAQVIVVPVTVKGVDGSFLWGPLLSRLKSAASTVRPFVVSEWLRSDLTLALKKLASEKFDAVWVERIGPGECVHRLGFSRVVLDVDALDSVALRRRLWAEGMYWSMALHYIELAKTWAYESRLPRRFERVVVCNPSDLTFFRSSSRKVRVVPNGVVVEPPSIDACEDDDELLFVGQMDYEPNIDAVRHFVADILPVIQEMRPAARLTVVGRRPTQEVLDLAGDSCVIVGQVGDLSPYYNRASCVVVPMRQGAGTRLKVLEALSRGKAVVSTSIGAEGIEVANGEHLCLVDEPGEFARACVQLLNDPSRRRAMGRAAHSHVALNYEWSVVGQRVADVLEEVL